MDISRLYVSVINVADAEKIVRDVDLPAIQDGPLYQLMFPAWKAIPEPQQDEIVQWYADGLKKALEREKDNYLQIYASDGAPLGFCGWTLMTQRQRCLTVRPRPSRQVLEQAPLPEALDRSAWLEISKDLQSERERVLNRVDKVCRKLSPCNYTLAFAGQYVLE